MQFVGKVVDVPVITPASQVTKQVEVPHTHYIDHVDVPVVMLRQVPQVQTVTDAYHIITAPGHLFFVCFDFFSLYDVIVECSFSPRALLRMPCAFVCRDVCGICVDATSDTLFKCQDDDEASLLNRRLTSKTRPSWFQMAASVMEPRSFSLSLRSLVTGTRGASEADQSATSRSTMSLSGASHPMRKR